MILVGIERNKYNSNIRKFVMDRHPAGKEYVQ